MAVAMTYNSLLDDVRSYLERGYSAVSDPLVFEQLPFLVNLAERRISRDIKTQGFQVVATLPLVSGVNVFQKPDRWRETISFNIFNSTTPRTPLYSRVYEYIRYHYPSDAVTGVPNYYGDYDYQHWIVAPTPNQAYTLEVIYNEIPQFLGDDIQSNWLTEYAPNLLLYATLLEATPFLKNDERIATWQAFYERALSALNAEDNKKVIDRTASRQEV